MIKFIEYILTLKKIKKDEEKKKYIELLLKKGIFPDIRHIFFETTDYCNGTCSFCPIGLKLRNSSYTQISDKNFNDIVLKFETFGKDYKYRISLFNNNEPFTDSNIIFRASFVRKIFPKAIIHLSTNGTLIQEDTILQIKQSEYDYIKINCYDEFTYNRLNKYCMEFNGKFNIRYNKCKMFICKRFNEKNTTYTNRGGSLIPHDFIYSSPCILPLFQLSIDMNGNINKCCYDALQKSNFDNILKYNKVEEFVMSDLYKKSYEDSIFNRAETIACNTCDVNDIDILDQQLF